jgi:hypothetical protein
MPEVTIRRPRRGEHFGVLSSFPIFYADNLPNVATGGFKHIARFDGVMA